MLITPGSQRVKINLQLLLYLSETDFLDSTKRNSECCE